MSKSASGKNSLPKIQRRAKQKLPSAVSHWWNLERVENGLRRFQRDFFSEKSENLPLSLKAYLEFIPAEEKNRPVRQKIYPPGPAIFYYFESMRQAWWKLGFTELEEQPTKGTYELTDELKAKLNLVYSVPFKSRKRAKLGVPSLQEVSDESGLPVYVLKRFARQMELTKSLDSPWSEAEILILDTHGFKSPASLVRVFRQAGFRRTEVAIAQMRKRRLSHKASPYFSLSAIALLFGVDSHLVSKWVNLGWLSSESKEIRRNEAIGNKGETRVCHKDSIYRFIVEHPDAFELKRVDQLWFLHIVTRGEVEFVKSSRLSRRSEAQLIEKPVEKPGKRKTKVLIKREENNK